MNHQDIDELARLVALRTRRKLGQRAGLRLVSTRNLRSEIPTAPPPGRLQPFERDIIYSRIRDLARIYGLGLLVRQETAHRSSRIECLEDDELLALLGTMERARECVMDGTPIDEAGLIRRARIAGSVAAD